MKTIYIGNLPENLQESDVKELFEQHGEVQSVQLIINRMTGRSRGFGFVRMNKDQAYKAISQLNHKNLFGTRLHVQEALDRRPHKAPDLNA